MHIKINRVPQTSAQKVKGDFSIAPAGAVIDFGKFPQKLCHFLLLQRVVHMKSM